VINDSCSDASVKKVTTYLPTTILIIFNVASWQEIFYCAVLDKSYLDNMYSIIIF
jgi:glucan phosphoethanolaminetransferase (alkaline phosphatase superfamily)